MVREPARKNKWSLRYYMLFQGILWRLPNALHRALTGRNLRWMQLVLGRQLRDRLMALDRLKRHLGFELSRKPSPRSHGGSSSASMNLP